MTFMASLRKECMELWRTYRLLILFVVILFFGMSSPLLARYTSEIIKLVPGGDSLSLVIPTPTVADALAQYIKNTSQFGILLVLLLTMGSIAQEKDRRTTAMILVKPLRRSYFVITKFLALSLAFLASLLIAGLGAWYYTQILFQSTGLLDWLLLNLLLWVYFLVYIALTLLFSTLTSSQPAAAGLSFGVLIVLSLVGSIGEIGKYLPAQLMTWAASLMGGNVTTAWPAFWISLGLIFASLLAACVVFAKQEL